MNKEREIDRPPHSTSALLFLIIRIALVQYRRFPPSSQFHLLHLSPFPLIAKCPINLLPYFTLSSLRTTSYLTCKKAEKARLRPQSFLSTGEGVVALMSRDGGVDSDI
ncbi:hypothetical protein ACTXT7_013868 [Hymenolepis weldensis]